MNVGKNKSISTFFFLPATLDPFIISRRRRSLQHARYTGKHTETKPASLFAFNRRDYHFHSNRHHHRLVQRASTHHHHDTSKPFDFSFVISSAVSISAVQTTAARICMEYWKIVDNARGPSGDSVVVICRINYHYFLAMHLKVAHMHSKIDKRASWNREARMWKISIIFFCRHITSAYPRTLHTLDARLVHA